MYNDSAHLVSFNNRIDKRSYQHAVAAVFFQHTVKHQLVLFGIGIAVAQTAYRFKLLEKLLTGHKVQRYIDHTHRGKTAKCRGVLNYYCFCSCFSGSQRRTDACHAAADDHDVVFAVYRQCAFAADQFSVNKFVVDHTLFSLSNL